jgi:DHA2 family multidrug resistance protein
MFLFVSGLGALIFWETRHRSPVVNFRPLMERNFAVSSLIIFCAFGVLYATSTLTPAMLQALFGYDAYRAGLVLSPAGFFSVTMLVVVGGLIGRGVDARWLITGGLLTLGAGSYWMSLKNLDMSPWDVVWPRVVLIIGLSLIFAPINVAAYLYTPKALRGAAVGLFALLRNEGGSVGVSMSQTIQERREQIHALRLNEHLDPFNPAVTDFMQQTKAFFLQQTGDPVLSTQLALKSLDGLRNQQASSLAYFDCFWLFAIMAFCLALLVPLMKRSVAEKGAHLAAD